METRVRIRVGSVEVEVVGEEEFVINRMPNLVSDLIGRLSVSGVPSSDANFVSIDGSVRDYWSDAPVAAATVSTIGLTPGLISLTDERGRFILSGRATGEQYSLLVSGPTSYYVETNNPVESLTEPTTLTAVAVAIHDLNRQYTSLGFTRTPGTAIIIIELLDSNGAPLERVPASNIILPSASGVPAGFGPYFFGANGDIQPDLSISLTFANRARAAFINIPNGEYMLQVTAPGTGNALPKAIVAVWAAGGATVIRARLPA